jgi:ankyrin repeat protein
MVVFPALFCGEASALTYVLAHGVNANASASQPETGMTALHHQCKHGRPTLVPELLKAGADPGVRDHDGRTPLDLAKVVERQTAFQYLGSLGVDGRDGS